MNWDRIEGNWKEFKGKAIAQWGKLTDDEVDRLLQTLRTGVSKTVASLPSHDSYVRRYCGAQDTAPGLHADAVGG